MQVVGILFSCLSVSVCARSTVVYPTRLILPYPSTPDYDRGTVWGIKVNGVGRQGERGM